MENNFLELIGRTNDVLKDAIINPSKFGENADLVAAFELKTSSNQLDE